MNGATGVTIPPDGKIVYVAGHLDNALAGFDRNTTTGALTYSDVFIDGQDGVDGLNWPRGVTVSPDDKNVYVTGYGDDAIAVFSWY